MSVIVDTAVWSLGFRRARRQLSPRDRRHVEELRSLLLEGLAIMPGPVRQELLTGIPDRLRMERLKAQISGVPDLPLTVEDYEEAATHSNTCRARGIAAAPIDILLCAAAIRRDLPIYTLDTDFERYHKALSLRLFNPGF